MRCYCSCTTIIAALLILLISTISCRAQSMQDEGDNSFFLRLQKSGRHPMKAFMSRFPYHNPMFQLREEEGRPRPFSGF